MAEPNSFAPGIPAWVDLVTSDPEGARTFYGTLLGWEFDIGGPETGFYTYCTRDGRRAAGMVGAPVDTMPTAWTTYLATDDVDATGTAMTAAGANLMLGPADAGPAGRVVVATDPVGAVIGAWEGREHLGAEITDAPGAVVWTELVTADLGAATPFYSAVFGHQWDESEPAAAWARYLTFSAGEQLAGGAGQPAPHGPPADPARWLTYFSVESLDAASAAAQRLGGDVVGAPVESPFGRWVHLRDPQGGAFAVLQQAQW